MDIRSDKRYTRMEAVIYIEMLEGETQEEAEDRLLCGLPEGMDVASYKSEYWEPDE